MKHKVPNRINRQIFPILPFLFLFMAFAGNLSAQSRTGEAKSLFHQISARLLVKNGNASGDRITLWNEEQGGYYTQKSRDLVVLRLPAEKLDKLKSLLETESSELLDYSRSAEDLKEDFLMTRSALEAKEELLQKNLSYLNRSDFQGTLSLEREIRRLGNEIDALKGHLRFLENNSRFAYVELYFSFKNQSILQDRPSRFDWINSMNFYKFMKSRPHGSLWGIGKPVLPLPEGFALASRRPFFQAISPEGVRIRLKEVENYPRQSLDFWIKALNRRLANKGCISLSLPREFRMPSAGEKGSGEKISKDRPFLLSRWGLPWENQDYLYLTGLRLRGKKLQVLEIAGPAAYVNAFFPPSGMTVSPRERT